MTPQEENVPRCVCGKDNCGINFGECHCGCGGKTTLAKQTERKLRRIKNLPIEYINRHARRKKRGASRYGVIDGEPVVFMAMSNGVDVIVDRDKEGEVAGAWCPTSNNPKKTYASQRRDDKIVLMHRVLIGVGEDVEVDHENRNRLDNRISNLRIADKWEQAQNQGISSRNSTGVKGTSWHKASKKYRAYISAFGEDFYLGLFATLEAAGKAREDAERELFGKFARKEIKTKKL